MKKILAVIITCFTAILITFLLTHNVLNVQNISSSIQQLLYKIVDKTQLQYSNELKVNRLQMENATYNFDKLNDDQKKMYAAIAKAVKELNSVVNIDNYSSDDNDRVSKDAEIVMTAFFADHPEVFYLSLTYKLSVSKSVIFNRIQIDLTYSVKDKQDLEVKLQQIESAMNECLANLDNKTDFEKELYLHDILAKNIKYYRDTTVITDIPEEYHTIYGAFVEKQAVCDGFAKAIQLLLAKVNIENILITGKIDEVAHAWNMVKFDYEWYHLDLTSDKYIKEADGTTKTVAHTYFNVTDEFILKSHTIDSQELNPVANTIDYNYYVKTDCYISSSENFADRIKQIIDLQRNNNSLEFATDVGDVPTKLLNVLYDLNFNGYKSNSNNVKMKYYNENNTYIVEKQ